MPGLLLWRLQMPSDDVHLDIFKDVCQCVRLYHFQKYSIVLTLRHFHSPNCRRSTNADDIEIRDVVLEVDLVALEL